MNKLPHGFAVLMAISLATSTCFAATWYVDDSAAGSGTGTSWADAWTNLSVVPMSTLRAGDTVEIAAGNYNGMTCNKAGAPGLPITFRLARDADRQGHVYIETGINIYADYITLNGAFDPEYPVPASVNDLDSITNNIGMHITEPNWTAINVAGGDRTGVRLLWLHVYDAGNLDKDFPASGEPAEYAVSLGDVMTDFECAYSWFQDNIYGDTFNSPKTHTGWGGASIHDCLIYNVGDDAFQIGGGFDIYRCKISLRTWGYASGHTDAFQTWGRRVRIHHNIIKDFCSEPGTSGYASIGYVQMSTELNGDFLFYNNLIFDQSSDRMGSPGLKFSHDAWWAPNKYVANNVISNIVVVNNLFLKPAAQVFAHAFTWVSTDASRGTNDLFTFTDCLFANNIILHSYNQSAGQLQGVVAAWPTHTDLTAINSTDGGRILSDFDRYQVKNNLIVAPNGNVFAGNMALSSIASMSATWPNASGNGTAEPLFEDYIRGRQNPEFDFRLTAEDTSARDQGLDLSAYVSRIPMLDEDLNGKPRGYNGAWDIGPYEYAGEDGSVPDLVIITSSLPDGMVGTPFSTQLVSGGGQSPHEWSLAPGSGALPGDLSLVGSGLMSGTLSVSGTFNIMVRVTDGAGSIVDRSLSLVVSPVPSTLDVLTVTLPNGQVGSDYSVQLQAGGGTSPYMWTVAPGSANLPSWLTFGPGGLLSGTPLEVGAYHFTVQVADAAGDTFDRELTLTVSAGNAASSLLLHINFDDTDWAKGYLSDASGQGNHGYEFGHGSQQNWPTITSRPIEGGGSSQCAEFHWDYDPTIDTYLRSGAYLAVTNLQDFGAMPQMTVSAWAFYDTSRDVNGNPVSWTADGEACIVSAGFATTNAWEFARTGSLAPKVKLFNANNATAWDVYNFQYTFDSNGKSDAWHHYAFVFDNGVLTLYQDGQPWSTNQHTLGTIGVAGGWIGIGCKTHGASVHSTPQFGDDLYPNHGWMNGMIDDVRIYGRALSPAEMHAVYLDQGAVPGDPAPLPASGLFIGD